MAAGWQPLTGWVLYRGMASLCRADDGNTAVWRASQRNQGPYRTTVGATAVCAQVASLRADEVERHRRSWSPHMTRTKVAVVGLQMGRAHANAFATSTDAKLAYVVDLDAELAAEVGEELGCGHTTDWESIIDEVDAISFATPHHLHYDQAMTAITAGKHVLMEKPLANSEQECLELIEAAQVNDVRLMIAYVVRYLPAIRRLKVLLDGGEHGVPISAQGWVQAYLEPRPNSWFSSRATLGGGVLFSHGCHYVDILIHLFGDPVRVAHVGTRNGTEWLEGEGTSQAILAFDQGVVANLVSSWGIVVARPPARYQIHTTTGLLQLNNDMWTIEWTTREDGTQVLFTRPDDAPPNVQYEVDHFLTSIATGTSPETDGVEALRSHRAIWEMYGDVDDQVDGPRTRVIPTLRGTK